MAYTTGFRHDVFVSYARKDDEQDWVTDLLHRLSSEISRRLGRGGNELRFFRDSESFRANANLTGLTEAVRQSALFLALGSPSYSDSDWCLKELREAAKADPQGTHRFMIEMLPLRRDGRYDAAISEQNRFEFWTRNKHFSDTPIVLARDDKEYDTKIQKLAGDIVEDLEAIRKTGAPTLVAAGVPTQPNGNGGRQAKGIVYLADATDDLDNARDEVRTYLEQFGYQIRPSGEMPSSGELRQAVEAALNPKPKLFVQLLSDLPGRRPASLPEGKVRAQFDAAAKAGVETMLWRRPGIDLSGLRERDGDHHGLVTGENVVESTLESFKEAVLRKLDKPEPEAEPAPANDILLMNSDRPDLDAAKQIQMLLSANDKMSIIADLVGDAGARRKILTKAFTTNRYVMFIHGQGDIEWLVDQTMLYWQLNARDRRKGDKVVAVVLGPPGDKPDNLGIGMPGLKYVDCRDGWNIEPILDVIEGRVP